MNAVFGAIPILFRHPSVYGLSRITSSLYISNGEAANNKLFLYGNQITTVINVSVEDAGALRGWCEPFCGPVHRLPDEIPLHVPGQRAHVGQILPPHHPAQQWLLAAAHPV
ncbi:dual specificity protein phosphatase 18 isoform X2 [Varanus komodoensis]|uniref:dual specificity protein phosphatase 18 isoform X2 n=1 Tax=Varanus komodoensis TaxID=61221 RepID=UPI001CF7CA4B|nr:dual specificity protein phosphatase 18 isoform X2 [Varanus komodoensis]